MIKQFGNLLSLFDLKTRLRILALIIPISLVAGLEMMSVALVLPVLQILLNPQDISAAPVLGGVYELFSSKDQRTFVVVACLSLGGLFIFKNVFQSAVIYWQNRFVFRKLSEFMCILYGIYLRHPYVFFLDRNTATFQRNIFQYATNVFSNGLLGILYLTLELLIVISICTILLIIDPLPAVVITVVLGAVGFGLQKFMSPVQANWGRRRNNMSREILQWISQSTGAIKEIKILKNEAYFCEKFRAKAESFAGNVRNVQTYAIVPRAVVETAMVIVLFGLLITYLLTGNEIKEALPILGVYGIAALRLLPSANKVLQLTGQLKVTSASVNDLYIDLKEILSEKPPEGAPENQNSIGFDSVEFKNVEIVYPNAHKNSLVEVNLKIRSGETIGVVGPSGSGKTTLVDALLGLLPVTNGRIVIDGQDISHNIMPWRDIVGYVPQNVYLLDDTIKRNVAFGIKDEDIDENRVLEVLSQAEMQELTDDLPDGTETMIGELGARISGGQRQRIGIARALYQDPQILILDEATSSLDGLTECKIANTIEKLSGTRTIIIVAHNLSNVAACDRVILLDDGKVSGEGTFDELLISNPKFRELAKKSELEILDSGQPEETF